MFAADGNYGDSDEKNDAFVDKSSDPPGKEPDDIEDHQQTMRAGPAPSEADTLVREDFRNERHEVAAEQNMKRKQQQHRQFFETILDIKTMLKVPAGPDVALKNHDSSATEKIVDHPDIKSGIPMTMSVHRQREILFTRFLFLPNGPKMMLWDLIVIFAILYSVFDVPLRIGFKNAVVLSPAESAWDYTITALFFADILVTVNVPYYDRKSDMIIINRGSIVKRYLSSWFVIDIVAAMPFDVMIEASSVVSDTQLRAMKLIRIIRLSRLTKIYKLIKFGALKEFLDDQDISPAFINTLALSFQLIVVAHLIACFWFFITTPDVTGVSYPPEGSGLPFESRTWVTEAGLEYAGVASQYIASLYFTFASLFTVGYGDIHATNTGERFFCIWVEFCAAILFAALIARVRAVVDSQNLNAKALRTKMEDFKSYLKEKDVKEALKTLAKDAYAYYLQKVPTLAETGFYEDLPQIIKIKFVQHKFMREIRHIHWFRNSDVSLIADMIIYMKPQQAAMGEFVYGMGDYAEEIGFLMKGNIRLLCRHGTQKEIMGFCSSGGYFGDFEYFHRSPRIAMYQAIQACTLFTIGFNRFDNALADNDDAKVRFLRKLRRRYDNFFEVKAAPLLHGSIDDYICRVSPSGVSHAIRNSGGEKGENTVEKMLLHDRMWTDGEVEKIFADITPHQCDGVAATISSVQFSAENALPMLELKIKRTENIYYNVITRKKRGGQDEMEELPLDYFSQHWLLFPSSKYKIAWDAFMGLLIFYSVLVIPMQICFDDMGNDEEMWSAEYALDFCFFFDIIAAMNTAYYSSDDDAYVTVRERIVLNYAKSWMLVDLLSTIPFDLLVSAATQQGNGSTNTSLIQLVKVLRLLRIFKLIKLLNFTQFTNYIEDQFAVPAVVFNLADMFGRIIFISHIVACLWWGLTAKSMTGSHWFDEKDNTGDLLGDATFQDQYVASLYWVIQTLTTTGYGDVVPITDNERIVAIIIVVFGATVFSYVVAHISELISSFNQAEARVAHRITEVKEFLSDARVSSTLFAEVADHFKQSLKHNSGFDEHAILRRLPIRVRDQLMLYHYHELFAVVPIFRYIENPSVKLYILRNMRQQSVDAGRFIVREDDVSDNIVFVFKGVAEMKKAIYSAAEKRLRERAKFGQLGAALLWCLRAHKALQIEDMEERMDEEQRMVGSHATDFKMVVEQLSVIDDNDDAAPGVLPVEYGTTTTVAGRVHPLSSSSGGTGTGGVFGRESKPFAQGSSSSASPTVANGRPSLFGTVDSDTASRGEGPVSSRSPVTRSPVTTTGQSPVLSRGTSFKSRRESTRRHLSTSESGSERDSTAISVNRFRHSARAKIRWEKIKMYLGTIVTMGFQRKQKVYETLGEVGVGGFFGHMECIKKAPYPCSLVATETCSYCVLNADVVLRIVNEYPAIGIQLQSALGRSMAESERTSSHQEWQRKNLSFLEEVRKEYTQETKKTSPEEAQQAVFRRGSQFVSNVAEFTTRFGKKGSAAVYVAADDGSGAGASIDNSPAKQVRSSGSAIGGFRAANKFSRGRVEVLSRKVDHMQEFFENSTNAIASPSLTVSAAAPVVSEAPKTLLRSSSRMDVSSSIHGIVNALPSPHRRPRAGVASSHGPPSCGHPAKVVRRVKMYRSEADALTAIRATAALEIDVQEKGDQATDQTKPPARPQTAPHYLSNGRKQRG